MTAWKIMLAVCTALWVAPLPVVAQTCSMLGVVGAVIPADDVPTGAETNLDLSDSYTLPTDTGPDMDVSGVPYGDDVRYGSIIVVDQEGNRRIVRSPIRQDR